MTLKRNDDRDSALELLRSQHTFPGPYVFRVVAHQGHVAGIVSAVGAALTDRGVVDRVGEKPSRTGKYLSIRLFTEVDSPETILDVYEVLSSLDSVVMTL